MDLIEIHGFHNMEVKSAEILRKSEDLFRFLMKYWGFNTILNNIETDQNTDKMDLNWQVMWWRTMHIY